MAYLAPARRFWPGPTAYAEVADAVRSNSGSDPHQLHGNRHGTSKVRRLKLATQDYPHNREKIEPTVKWHVTCPHDAELILCENLVLAGGQDEVCAFSRQNGACVWKAAVEGNARSLVVAMDTSLQVPTRDGSIASQGTDKAK
jgi:hypothetical protein